MVPLLLAIIAILIIGGGVYLYTQKNQPPTIVLNQVATTTAQTTNQISATKPNQPNDNINFSASPTSGTAPLAVNFSTNAPGSTYSIEFGGGDGAAAEVGGNCGVNRNQDCGKSYTYTSPGVYTAYLIKNGEQTISSTTITVTGWALGIPTATIDSGSLTTSSSHPTFTGTAANIAGNIGILIGPGVTTKLEKNSQVWASGPISVTNSRWSSTVSPPYSLSPGIYTVFVYAYGVNYPNLASGTLTVTY